MFRVGSSWKAECLQTRRRWLQHCTQGSTTGQPPRLAAAVVKSITYHRLAASETSCTCKLLRFQECQDTDFQDPGVLFPAVCWYERTRWRSQATVVPIVIIKPGISDCYCRQGNSVHKCHENLRNTPWKIIQRSAWRKKVPHINLLMLPSVFKTATRLDDFHW